MTLQGRVENGVVVFQNRAGAAPFPDGTWVEITPLPGASNRDPFADDMPVSKERQEALRQLIGICKTAHPPSDEEVERILEEERMKKYG